MKFFEGLSEATCNKLEEEDVVPSSLRVAYLSPGDVFYLPAGHLCLEKSLNTNSVGLRVACMLVDEGTMSKLNLIGRHGQGILDIQTP